MQKAAEARALLEIHALVELGQAWIANDASRGDLQRGRRHADRRERHIDTQQFVFFQLQWRLEWRVAESFDAQQARLRGQAHQAEHAERIRNGAGVLATAGIHDHDQRGGNRPARAQIGHAADQRLAGRRLCKTREHESAAECSQVGH